MPSYPNLSKGEGLIRTHELLEQTINDVFSAFEVLESEKESQFLRRSLVRTVFSFIEGIIHILKFELRSEIRKGEVTIDLSRKEEEVLYEEKERNGELTKIFIATDENLKKTFKITKKIWNLENYRFKSGGKEYKSFLKAKKARDRLTHPRTYYDLQITDEDMYHMTNCFEWIKTEFESLMRERVKNIADGLPEEFRKKFLEKMA